PIDREFRNLNAATPPPTSNSTTTHAASASVRFIDVIRNTNADRGSKSRGTSWTRSQISGGSVSVFTSTGVTSTGVGGCRTGVGVALTRFGAYASRQRATSSKVRTLAHVNADAPARVTASVFAPYSINAFTVSP